jgi:hypothetical protein
LYLYDNILKIKSGQRRGDTPKMREWCEPAHITRESSLFLSRVVQKATENPLRFRFDSAPFCTYFRDFEKWFICVIPTLPQPLIFKKGGSENDNLSALKKSHVKMRKAD